MSASCLCALPITDKATAEDDQTAEVPPSDREHAKKAGAEPVASEPGGRGCRSTSSRLGARLPQRLSAASVEVFMPFSVELARVWLEKAANSAF